MLSKTTQPSERLRGQIQVLEIILGSLKKQLSELPTTTFGSTELEGTPYPPPDYADTSAGTMHEASDILGREEYKRYGRQMIMPEIGLKGLATLCPKCSRDTTQNLI